MCPEAGGPRQVNEEIDRAVHEGQRQVQQVGGEENVGVPVCRQTINCTFGKNQEGRIIK